MPTRRSHLYYLLYVCKGTYFAANESQKQKNAKKIMDAMAYTNFAYNCRKFRTQP